MNIILKRSFLLLATSFFASPALSAEHFDPKDYRTEAQFKLVVEQSKYLKPGTSKITARSAFVSLAHGLMPGNADGIEVMFFTKPVTDADLSDIIGNDAKEMQKGSYAAMVLFLDKANKVWQVNLSFIVPGTTVARTVAWKPEDLKRYFSNMAFQNGRLVLKSAGTYSEADPAQDLIKLDWKVDLDLPVKREVRR